MVDITGKRAKIAKISVGSPGISSSSGSSGKWKRNNRRALKWVIAAALIVAALVFLLQLWYAETPAKTENKPLQTETEIALPVVAGDLFPDIGDAKDGHLSNMTLEQIKAQMQRVAEESQFSFKINSRPVFADGGAKGSLGIENPNYNVYPMVVQIFLDSTGEMIYDSGGILPNQHIDSAKLLSELAAGEYNATAVFNAYDPDTKVWQGKAQAALIITVQS